MVYSIQEVAGHLVVRVSGLTEAQALEIAERLDKNDGENGMIDMVVAQEASRFDETCSQVIGDVLHLPRHGNYNYSRWVTKESAQWVLTHLLVADFMNSETLQHFPAPLSKFDLLVEQGAGGAFKPSSVDGAQVFVMQAGVIPDAVIADYLAGLRSQLPFLEALLVELQQRTALTPEMKKMFEEPIRLLSHIGRNLPAEVRGVINPELFKKMYTEVNEIKSFLISFKAGLDQGGLIPDISTFATVAERLRVPLLRLADSMAIRLSSASSMASIGAAVAQSARGVLETVKAAEVRATTTARTSHPMSPLGKAAVIGAVVLAVTGALIGAYYYFSGNSEEDK